MLFFCVFAGRARAQKDLPSLFLFSPGFKRPPPPVLGTLLDAPVEFCEQLPATNSMNFSYPSFFASRLFFFSQQTKSPGARHCSLSFFIFSSSPGEDPPREWFFMSGLIIRFSHPPLRAVNAGLLPLEFPFGWLSLEHFCFHTSPSQAETSPAINRLFLHHP